MISRDAVWEVSEGRGIGPLELGMDRRAVHALLGDPSHAEKPRMLGRTQLPAIDRLWQNVIEVNYVDDVVTFVAVNWDERLHVALRGVRVFDVLFRDLAPWLATQTEVDAGEEDFPGAWTFPALSLCLWREGDETGWRTRARPKGDRSTLFVEQIAIKARFAEARDRPVKLSAPRPMPPSGMASKRAEDILAAIEASDPGGREWSSMIARLRAG